MALRLWVAPSEPFGATVAVRLALGAVLVSACASAAPRADGEPVGARQQREERSRAAGPSTVAVPNVRLAGARCRAAGAACTCRAAGDDAETEPPAEGTKRLEIRLAAEGGEATLESPTLGRFVGRGPRDTCYYFDLVAGSTHTFQFASRADDVDKGFGPRLIVREYGPKGPWWYDVLTVQCDNGMGRCDRVGADQWGESLKTRKRGRVEPCGSTVVTGLGWETSGGRHERDGGNYRDFSTKFDVELKKFATQFAPGSTECVPK